MPTLQSMDFPKPQDWQEFERMVHGFSMLKWPDHSISPNGNNGDAQHGVDLYIKNKNGEYIGIQCKLALKDSPLPFKIIEKELERAAHFKPSLKRFIIATTAKRNAQLQEKVNLLSHRRSTNGLFDIGLLFWEDIIDMLKSDPKVLRKYYPELPIGPICEDRVTLNVSQNSRTVVCHLHIYQQGSRTRKGSAKRIIEGTIGSNTYQLNYIRHLIDRYLEYKAKDFQDDKKSMNYAIIYKSIQREMGFKWDEMPVEKFDGFCLYLQKKIDHTKFGRLNKAKGTKNYSSYSEYIKKHLKEE
ncbi:hypothetical protein [Paenibacillus sp. MSJ-34]|uniref:restriction endonuclease n=1 Tax=Paenibacillus sp. MSJ-34 TaxID=2841529 RepID=UPI001C0FA7E7|nr:hypothetical protein [Paenibacillus sp. MSJ-34]